MKKLLTAALFLTSLSSFATHDIIHTVEYASINMYGEETACFQKTQVWDGYGTSTGGAINIAMKALTSPQEIYAMGIGQDKIDINYLTVDGGTVTATAFEDYETANGKITITIDSDKASSDQLNLTYYLAAKNAFALGAQKVFINVEGDLSNASTKLFFPKKTKWPVTKSSPVFKKLEKQVKESKLISKCD